VTSSATTALVLLFIGMGMLGMGNGAVFQVVPQRFPASLGIVTGIVGAAGGLGGFLLPTLLGAMKDLTGEYRAGLWIVAFAFMAGSVVLLELGTRWASRWPATAIQQSGVFSYRAKSLGVPSGDSA
jgi:NNP family nitrate/nitrite transporter-like MFS transporter